jgi:5-methylcytosine-specific restriction endonuclease McrA
MHHVLVLDADRRPLLPCRPARARQLLQHGKAAVLQRSPFTIVLREARPDAVVELLHVKVDPGSRTTGITLLNDATGALLWAAEIVHRGQAVHDALDQRRVVRRSRRHRKTRYRAARFQNRRRRARGLPPSLASRVHHVLTWVERLCRLCPLGSISVAAVRCDTHLLQNPASSRREYQQGTLAGTEIREYLLLKWGYRCAYCHQTATRWEVDQIIPRSRGGSTRPSNLALACQRCNAAKGKRTAAEFGHAEVQAQAKAPRHDAAAVTSTRRAVQQRLLALGLPVETGSGGLTQCNRSQRHLPKTPWRAAACVGTSTPARLRWRAVVPLQIHAQGWQRRQLCLLKRFGCPRTAAQARRRVCGCQTGDLVRAVVPAARTTAGVSVGRVAVRGTGSFHRTTAQGTLQGLPARSCQVLQRADG